MPVVIENKTGVRAALNANNVVEIRFTYDPVVVNWVKQLGGRRWHSGDRKWTADLSIANVEALLAAGAEFDAGLKAWRRQQEYKPSVQINTDGLALYPFQKTGVEFIESRNGRALVADEMGLGKTVQALCWLRMRPDVRPVVVVCPASLKLNWEREARRWCPDDSVQVVNGRGEQTLTANIIIANYDILADDEVVANKPAGKNIVTACRADIKAAKPAAVILDESHAVKNRKTLRSIAVADLCRGVAHVIALTGTPVLNRPVELFNQLKIVQPALFPSFWRFAQSFCAARHNRFGWDFTGASNTEELNAALTSTVMIRRRKADVLPDLPAKQRALIPFEIDNASEYRYAEDQFIAWVTREFGREKAERTAKAEVLAQIEYLKQLCARGKLAAACEWIADFLETGKKLVVMAVHKEIINALMEKFAAVAVRVDGGTSQADRQTAVDRFQTDDSVRLFVGNIQAAGVGITLTAASDIAVLELPWSPGILCQAEDRVHRIGQEADSITAYYLLAAGTIDEKMADMIIGKIKTIGQVVDGCEEDGTVFAEILSAYGGRHEC
jgi:SNF2 family DNA or RNA helicase